MPWTNSGNTQLTEVQQLTGASAADMLALRQRIDNWANGVGPNARQRFEFGEIRDHHVAVTKSNGDIVAVTYGDQ